MRDRLNDLLPLLLVGVVLLVFHLSRLDVQTLDFMTMAEPTATPAVVVATPRAKPPLRAASATRVVAVCNPAQPQFSGGLATLKTVLGSSMGEPLECEHSVSLDGDTQQKTTTGLAYYRKQLNAACFTTGWDHWGMLRGDLVRWSGHDVDPPEGGR
jgi:hypothetical protein